MGDERNLGCPNGIFCSSTLIIRATLAFRGEHIPLIALGSAPVSVLGIVFILSSNGVFFQQEMVFEGFYFNHIDNSIANQKRQEFINYIEFRRSNMSMKKKV